MGKLCDRCNQVIPIWDHHPTCVRCRLTAGICTLGINNPCSNYESWSTITLCRFRKSLKEMRQSRHRPPLMRVRPRPWFIWSPRHMRHIDYVCACAASGLYMQFKKAPRHATLHLSDPRPLRGLPLQGSRLLVPVLLRLQRPLLQVLRMALAKK